MFPGVNSTSYFFSTVAKPHLINPPIKQDGLFSLVLSIMYGVLHFTSLFILFLLSVRIFLDILEAGVPSDQRAAAQFLAIDVIDDKRHFSGTPLHHHWNNFGGEDNHLKHDVENSFKTGSSSAAFLK